LRKNLSQIPIALNEKET